MINCFANKFFRKAVIIAGCLFAVSCENSQRSLDEWRETREMVEEATGVETFFSQNGNMRARLNAPFMQRFSMDTIYVQFPNTLNMVFFDSIGRAESNMSALFGIYYESLNKAYMRDSVVVANIHGDTLWAPDLWWDQNTQRFYTDKNVRIFRRGDRIYGGRGFEAKQDLSDIIIRRPTGTVIIPDSVVNDGSAPPGIQGPVNLGGAVQ